MKYLIILFITTAIFFLSGCGDAGVKIIPPSTDYIVSGTIPNWTAGTVKLKAVVKDTNNANGVIVDSTTINSSGAFSLTMKNIADNMYRVIRFSPPCSSYVSVTGNSKWSYPVEFIMYRDTGNIGTLIRTGPSFIVTYAYLNQVTGLSGNLICGIDTLEYYFTGVTGANKFVYLTDRTNHRTVTSTEPDGGQWNAVFIPVNKKKFLLRDFKK